MLGYCDGGVESRSPQLISYWVGYSVCIAAPHMNNSPKPEERCLSSLGPGRRELIPEPVT